jgi:hypothetical protein
MTKHKKWIQIIIVVFLIFSSTIVLFLKLVAPISLGLGGSLNANKLREKLLCEIDHHALLKAGREILGKVSPLENKTKDRQSISGYLPFPKEVKEKGLPQVIQKLEPHSININHVNYEIYLTIQMHRGMDHFGVRIYPKAFNVPFPSFQYGDRKLIDGLWYYDDGYLHNPGYDKRIDEIIKKGK